MWRTLAILGCLIAVTFGPLGCAQEGGGKGADKKGESDKLLATKKVVFIIAPKDFRDEELEEPLARLRAGGCAATIACSSLETATGMLGAKAKPEVLLKNVKAADYDAVIFIGGVGASVYFDDPAAQAVAKAAVAGGKILGAICLAPSTLARAGVLKDKTATAWASQKDDLEKGGARWSDESAVRDGQLVTANGPKAAGQFAELLVQALTEGPVKR